MSDVDNNLKKRIMRRIYVLWFFRKATSFLALEIYGFVIFVSFALYHISFFDVVRNAFSPTASYSTLHVFLFHNFMVTGLLHETLILGTMAMTLILGWELFRKIIPSTS
jgi:hypothetical protein